jgi:hypothetical protein
VSSTPLTRSGASWIHSAVEKSPMRLRASATNSMTSSLSVGSSPASIPAWMSFACGWLVGRLLEHEGGRTMAVPNF